MFTIAKIGKRILTTKRIQENYSLSAKNSIKKGRP